MAPKTNQNCSRVQNISDAMIVLFAAGKSCTRQPATHVFGLFHSEVACLTCDLHNRQEAIRAMPWWWRNQFQGGNISGNEDSNYNENERHDTTITFIRQQQHKSSSSTTAAASVATSYSCRNAP